MKPVRPRTPLGSRSNEKIACDSDKMLATTRYHHNPLFTSSPADNLIEGDFEIPCEDYKENCWAPDRIGSNAGKAKALDRVCPKRVLGERNTFQERHEQQEYFDVDEPPKSIRALSFPSMECTDFGYNGEENSSSSLSTSPASEVSHPRFALSPPQETVSPTWSDSSVDSLDGNAYDPKANLRTPRPKFLRYRPDWRLQFISSLESRESETSEDASQLFSSLQSESECNATAVHKLQFEGGSNAGIANSASTGVEDEIKISNRVVDCNAKCLHVGGTETTGTAFNKYPVNSTVEAENDSIEEVIEKEEEISIGEKHVEVDEDVLSSGAKIPRALIYVLFLGIFVPFSLMAAGSTGLLPQIAHGNVLSSFWQGCRYKEAFEGLWGSDIDIDIDHAIVDPHFLHSMVDYLRDMLEPMNSLRKSKKMNDDQRADIEEWDWLPEYDITGYFRNQTQGLDVFWTDSEELDALLMAIMFGTEEDIQERYLELMEVDDFGIHDFDYFPEDLKDAPGFTEGATEVLTEVLTDDLNVTSSALVDNNDLGQDSFHVADEEGGAAALASDEGIDSSGENMISAAQIAGSVPIEREFDTQHGLSLINGISPRENSTDTSSFEKHLPSIDYWWVSTYGLAFLASVLFSIPAYFSYRGSRKRRVVHKKKSKLSTFQQEARATIARTVLDLVPTPEKDKAVEDLLISTDCLKQSPYGSFTAYKRIVLNEGSENEQVRLTPVRRSSRIRSHAQSPAAQQRVVSSPEVVLPNQMDLGGHLKPRKLH